MVALTLMGLPNELLNEIIQHALPEGFESLALTCTTLYALCTPYISYHNRMRSKFRAFGYGTYSNDPSFPPILTATELITRIAAEPRAARYIIHADMSYDDWPNYSWISPPLPDVDAGGPVVALFAQCPYLKQAGLDWKHFYTRVVNDYTEYHEDSPYATAFVLTLLPNIRTLRLAYRWDPDTTLSALIDQIVGKAREPTSLWNRPCLSELTVLEPYCGSGPGSPPVDLNKAIPLLALPRLRVFHGGCYITVRDDPRLRPPPTPYTFYGKTLESVTLDSCWMDPESIAEFLAHTPRLKVFNYSHTLGMRVDTQGWDLCRFVAAIGRKVGSHLERLSIGIRDRHAPVLPGKASMRDFRRLQRLEIPLELALCSIHECEAQANVDRAAYSRSGACFRFRAAAAIERK
ncbi:hypothetical protein F5X98DRAFT_366476 [Xylaria grammica]|nr:hypothetical protein F5X98DRAFT_366476 [Xylaria grammica]